MTEEDTGSVQNATGFAHWGRDWVLILSSMCGWVHAESTLAYVGKRSFLEYC